MFESNWDDAMLMKELIKLTEDNEQTVFHGFKCYVQDAYGHGLDPSAISTGEMLTDEDGNTFEFVGITSDGKKITVKVDDKDTDVEPSTMSGAEIFPATTKPVGKGWAKSSIGDFYRNSK